MSWNCSVSVLPAMAVVEERPPLAVTATTNAGDVVVPLRGRLTVEGHAAFTIRGGQSVEIAWDIASRGDDSGVEIGGITRVRALKP